MKSRKRLPYDEFKRLPYDEFQRLPYDEFDTFCHTGQPSSSQTAVRKMAAQAVVFLQLLNINLYVLLGY